MAKKRGRPKGSKNRKPAAPVVDQAVATCAKCGSANRTPYETTRTLEGPVSISGVTYQRIIYRRTKCLDCGQCRIDRSKIPFADKISEKR